MNNKQVRLSPRYGLNPSLGLCYFCGKENGEVIIAGHLPGDEEAPRQGVWTLDPCKDCAALMQQGIMLLSTSDNDRDYRTGRMVVVKEEAIRRLLSGDVLDNTLKHRFALVPDSVWKHLGLPT